MVARFVSCGHVLAVTLSVDAVQGLPRWYTIWPMSTTQRDDSAVVCSCTLDNGYHGEIFGAVAHSHRLRVRRGCRTEVTEGCGQRSSLIEESGRWSLNVMLVANLLQCCTAVRWGFVGN